MMVNSSRWRVFGGGDLAGWCGGPSGHAHGQGQPLDESAARRGVEPAETLDEGVATLYFRSWANPVRPERRKLQVSSIKA